MIAHAVLGDDRFDDAQRLFDGSISIHMHVDLHIGFPEPLEGGGQHFIGNLLIAAVTAALARRVVRVGFAKPGCVEAAIEPGFDATEPHAVYVAAVQIRSLCQQFAGCAFTVHTIGTRDTISGIDDLIGHRIFGTHI